MRSAASPTRQLLDLIASPLRVGELSGDGWDLVVRTARSARLLGTLAAILRREGALTDVPEGPRRHLESALVQADFRRQAVLRELRELEAVLAPLSIPLVALKGSAYLLQSLACAEGRLPADIDILVPKEDLTRAEAALREAGWESVPMEDYDDRYYREWSHQVPPLRRPGREIEVDLHHAIVPPTARGAFEGSKVWADIERAGTTRSLVLSSVDQFLHAVAHLINEDGTNRLRDIVDLHLLFVEFSAEPSFSASLQGRAAELGLCRPLAYAACALRVMTRTDVPPQLLTPPGGGGALRGKVIVRLLEQTLPPEDVEGRTSFFRRMAVGVLLARSLWLRFPLPLLLRHVLSKATRAFHS